MNKKSFFSIRFLLFFSLVFTFLACSQEPDVNNILVTTSGSSIVAEEENLNFTTEGLPFYVNSNLPSNVIMARFYDNNRNIPYVSLSLLLKASGHFLVDSVDYSNGKYYITVSYNNKKVPIKVDSKADTITCNEWVICSDPISPDFYEYHKKFIDLFQAIKLVFTGQKSRTFKLSDYGFKIYGGTDDAYVPLCVINSIFLNPTRNNWAYNGKGIFSMTTSHSNLEDSSWYKNEDGSLAERSQEQIENSYNLICFTHDYFYGYPGYYSFADDGSGNVDQSIVEAANKLKLDELLTRYDSETKELLKSSSYEDYIKGLTRFTNHTYGDGHSSFPRPNFSFAPSEEDFNTYKSSVISYKYKTLFNTFNELKEKRYQAGKSTGSDFSTAVPTSELSSDGKTYIFRFDSFDFNFTDWKSYFNQDNLTANPNPDDTSNGKVAVPSDTAGTFYRLFYKILNDSEYANVENVVIDLTCNRGGVVYALDKALTYLIEDVKIDRADYNTDTIYSEILIPDLNLDGKCDYSDTVYFKRLWEKNYTDENGTEKTDGRDLNCVILSSNFSFSCANAMACICEQAGIPVIGKTSGGGSCWIGSASTFDCFSYNYSYNDHFIRNDGSSFENGASVTKELTSDQFYDVDALKAIVEEIFGE
ncbi:MAG: S41 family peptidase [Treponema sp.]|nr:S41 family peptidase [Treponema sp.]